MKRKLVKQGAATMMISLPSKWVKQNKLDKGSEINLEEKENDLLITTSNSVNKKEIEFDINTDTTSAVRIMLVNAYRMGYDRIKVKYNSEKIFKVIAFEVTNHIIGFEITSKNNEYCIIENLTEPSKDQFDNIFSKIILNIEELINSTEEIIKGNKDIKYSLTEQRIMQYANFCRRILTKNKDKNYALEWAFHIEITHGQRELYHLLKYLEKNKIKKENLSEILVFLEHCKEIFSLIKKAYYEKNLSYIEKIHYLESEVTYKKGYNLLNKTKNPVIVHHILRAIRNFYHASSPLSTIILN